MYLMITFRPVRIIAGIELSVKSEYEIFADISILNPKLDRMDGRQEHQYTLH